MEQSHSKSALTVKSLTKSFDNLKAVDDLSFTARSGECLAILGPNGAGKTTLIKCLTGFLSPDEGKILYFEKPYATNRDWVHQRVGILSQEDNLDYDFTILQNLLVFFRYFRLKPDHDRAENLLKMFQLTDKKDTLPRTLSGGMKRKLQMARALVPSPSILFLDEPTTGLDPQARQNLWKIVHQLKKDGLFILLTTHYMDEAEKLADNIILMDRGKKLVEGPFSTLKKENFKERMLTTKESIPLLNYLKKESLEYENLLGTLRINLTRKEGEKMMMSFPQLTFSKSVPDLQDLFLKLTGRSLGDS